MLKVYDGAEAELGYSAEEQFVTETPWGVGKVPLESNPA